jgi:hypothetical protein
MHRGWKVFSFHDVQEFEGCRGVVGNGCGLIRPMDQAGVSVGILTHELSPQSGQPRVPIHMLVVEVIRHKDREPAAQAGGKVRLDYGSAG